MHYTESCVHPAAVPFLGVSLKYRDPDIEAAALMGEFGMAQAMVMALYDNGIVSAEDYEKCLGHLSLENIARIRNVFTVPGGPGA